MPDLVSANQMQACMIRKREVDGANTLLTLPTGKLGLGAIWLLCSSAQSASFTGVRKQGMRHLLR